MNIILVGLLASLAAGLMTGIGALPVLFGRTITQRMNDGLLGFAAGVMLAASFFSLILPGIEEVRTATGSGLQAALVAAGGVVLGAAAVAVMNEALPHEHFVTGPEGARSEMLSKVWLFVIAITIHNFPEGMAVGVGFGAGDVAQGTPLAVGIGLQNAPEGLAVAVALRAQGYGRGRSVAIALLTGLIEPVGGLLGVSAVRLSEPLLPWGLTFAAGAMLYIISHEIIPETHNRGHQNAATAGLTLGLVLMMILDVSLG